MLITRKLKQAFNVRTPSGEVVGIAVASLANEKVELQVGGAEAVWPSENQAPEFCKPVTVEIKTGEVVHVPAGAEIEQVKVVEGEDPVATTAGTMDTDTAPLT